MEPEDEELATQKIQLLASAMADLDTLTADEKANVWGIVAALEKMVETKVGTVAFQLFLVKFITDDSEAA